MPKNELRLLDLVLLEDGWLDGAGIAPTVAAIKAAGLLATSLVNGRLYPTEDGGVTVEWSIGNWELSIEVMADGECAEALAVFVRKSELPAFMRPFDPGSVQTTFTG